MKRLLPLLIVCILLLSGCKTAEGFLSMPDSPSADLPERPGFVSQEVSRVPSTEESKQELPDRSMTFLETDTPHLYRIQTRKGDLEILGMTYGDGTYFALTRRESGNAVTGYDADGTGTFAGLLDKDFSFPVLLGFADGYACVYSTETYRTFACKADSTYVWFNRKAADAVRLYRGGYAYLNGSTVTFYGPQYDKAYTSYTIPDDMSFLAGNEEQALVSRIDGALVRLMFDANGVHETVLSRYLAFDGNAVTVSHSGQTALFNPYDRTVIAASAQAKTVAAGDGYFVEELAKEIRFVNTKNGNAFCLPKDGAFRFGARTDDGFLFGIGGTWYLLEDEAFDIEAGVFSVTESNDLLHAAGTALCGASPAQIRLFADGAPFAVMPTTEGYSATRVTDGEALFTSAASILSAIQETVLPEDVHIYLCDSVMAGTTPVPYTMFADENATGILLDVTDPHYQAQLTEILTMLQEGIMG